MLIWAKITNYTKLIVGRFSLTWRTSIRDWFLVGNLISTSFCSYFCFVLPYVCFWRRQWQPTPVLLPGKSHGWRSLVGCRLWGPWGRWVGHNWATDFHLSLSCIGEGNGNPLQCSCLENPKDSGAWWAAIYGVAQSWTWLKQLSSSSSMYVLP